MKDRRATLTESEDFLTLSALINYQLSGEPVNWNAVLSLAAGGRIPGGDEQVMLEGFFGLNRAYGAKRRKLGPLAVLHPIRSAALLDRAAGGAARLDFLTAMFHDLREDILPDSYEGEWESLKESYREFLGLLEPTEAEALETRLRVLTKKPGEKYYEYLGRVLDSAADKPEILRVKLADRLDNTFDLRLELQDVAADIDVFRMLFEILFTGNKVSRVAEGRRRLKGRINSARRLFQMFKNAVFLSLVRKRFSPGKDLPADRLFETLAQASLRESQRVLAHQFLHHVTDLDQQRGLLAEAAEYSQLGGIAAVTAAAGGSRLDGVLTGWFDHDDKRSREAELDRLHRDKPLMALVSLAFCAVFASFVGDPDYRIRGIDERGISIG